MSLKYLEVFAFELRADLKRKANDCIQCGHCNSRCPFHVDQMARMKEISKYFGK